MKRLVGVIIAVLTLYAVFYDITTGTLPKQKKEDAVTTSTSNIPYFENKVSPGDTVLTIVEESLNKPIPVSITQVISDFQRLNNGTKPEEIRIGELYKFPDYKE